MASIRKRDRKDNTTIYQVRWLQGGRGGTWETEKFADEDSAKQFKQLVDAHGQHWPPGWVRGKGFVAEPAVPGDMPLTDWAHRYVDRLTGIDERTRRDYKRDVDNHFSILRHVEPSGRVAEATIANLTADDIQDWVRAQETGEQNPAEPGTWLRKPAGPKSIANRHGLLSAIVQAAIVAEPPLRRRRHRRRDVLPRARRIRPHRRRAHRPARPGPGGLARRQRHALGRGDSTAGPRREPRQEHGQRAARVEAGRARRRRPRLL